MKQGEFGSYLCELKKGSKVEKIYNTKKTSERHSHYYEYNNKCREEMEEQGLICSGLSPDGKFVEIIELENHPYFIACQFHPEFKSRPDKPHPLFVELVRVSKNK